MIENSPSYTVDTHDEAPPARRALTFVGAGKASGHGTVAWEPVTGEDPPVAPPWRPGVTRPVIALLDSGVAEHPWLPDDPEDPVCVYLDGDGPARAAGVDVEFGTHFGHATFIAGIIRQDAP